MFLAILGCEAGFMGLRLLATGGVYICGGIGPKVAATTCATLPLKVWFQAMLFCYMPAVEVHCAAVAEQP